jgi:hypothetical protein
MAVALNVFVKTSPDYNSSIFTKEIIIIRDDSDLDAV